jgi:hypothetical protein
MYCWFLFRSALVILMLVFLADGLHSMNSASNDSGSAYQR